MASYLNKSLLYSASNSISVFVFSNGAFGSGNGIGASTAIGAGGGTKGYILQGGGLVGKPAVDSNFNYYNF